MGTDPGNTKGAVVITGASSGIGEACALHLDKLGFRVFGTVRRETDAAALRQKASQHLTPLIMEVTEVASVDSAAEAVASAVDEKGLAGLVNNAGLCVSGPLEFMPLEKVREQFEVSVIGLVAVTQAFLPLLRQCRGRIINIGSVQGRKPVPFHAPYSASHFAMEALYAALRFELLPWGIQVSILQADAVDTPLRTKSQVAEDSWFRELPQEDRALYEGILDIRNQARDKAWQGAIGTISIAETVAEALTAEKPKNRYVVGSESAAWAIMSQFLPDERD
jgi:NAD(P)-dependent dehydrogenase (short-subunit alcohol dehydrogenase family)